MARKQKKKNLSSQRFSALAKEINREKLYSVEEAVALVKKSATAKFPESVDLAVRLGVDPKKGDQNVRGTTNLPHGTGKNKTVAVLASGDDLKAAQAAGADFAGDDDLIKKVQEGWKDFDVMLATEAMAPQIGKIGRFLGPRTPNKRNGTVTNDIAKAVKEIKGASRVEYRIDKAANVHVGIGKANFTEDQIKENLLAALDAIIRAKPASAKGRYLQNVAISSTMGPGVKIDPTLATKAAGH
ncbi:MAG TPA: 50S ribosomal protein L1 [Fimbriimonadaceae bacterium]|nr:50S ribosomal protein L1 [Fimbriimonadaceae bacterium]